MRFGSHRALIFGLLAILEGSQVKLAGAQPARETLHVIRDQALGIQAQAQRATLPQWLRRDSDSPGQAAGEALGREAGARLREQGEIAQEQACAALGSDCTVPQSSLPIASGQTLTLLVSRSLGAAALREILLGAATEQVRVVFRGVARGESMMDFVRTIHEILKGMDPVPLVELDPTPFRDTGASVVPLLVLAGPDGEIARVSGITGASWLKGQVRAGKRGDLGVRGPVEKISEPDMIKEIHRRIATLDMDALRERAVASFWTRTGFEHLEAASAARERIIDPTTVASADIRHPDGRFIVRKGERINPLDQMPFSMRLVVFDPTQPGQVVKARELGTAPSPGRTLYLATRFDRQSGWDGFQALEDALDEPVYLLTPDVRKRFALERVPATVEARAHRFVVREYPPGRP